MTDIRHTCVLPDETKMVELITDDVFVATVEKVLENKNLVDYRIASFRAPGKDPDPLEDFFRIELTFKVPDKVNNNGYPAFNDISELIQTMEKSIKPLPQGTMPLLHLLVFDRHPNLINFEIHHVKEYQCYSWNFRKHPKE